MARCPKCESRKGKRYCPALDRHICSRCCAEHRLETIPCPPDCVHLEGESYQHAKRRQRAHTQGRCFLDALHTVFLTSETREFGFLVQADAYWWMRRNGRLPDGLLRASFEDFRSRLSSVYVPSRMPLPLGKFLYSLQEGEQHQGLLGPRFTGKQRLAAIRALVRHIESLGDPDGYSYHEQLAAFFGELDFEADLDYSPEEELGERDPGEEAERRSAGGIFLPGP